MKKGLLLLVVVMMILLVACSKDKDSGKEKDGTNKAVTTEVDGSKDAGSEESGTNAPSEADKASKLVLDNTKLVEVFSLDQRMHEEYKEQGPFWVVRGIDAKGRTTEVWVQEGKIYDIE
jgi:basic membrane lipoprotein Med (substrate-binding protein (PBP1-ABC) superfamily)